jgi:hypothetical protein
MIFGAQVTSPLVICWYTPQIEFSGNPLLGGASNKFLKNALHSSDFIRRPRPEFYVLRAQILALSRFQNAFWLRMFVYHDALEPRPPCRPF